ncbi:MAG: helix-turn-helix domain-containing protein [Acutalibacteraceae bacterium]
MPYKKEINISLGMRVRKERERQKMTREVFAEKINVSTRFIADVESGLVGVSITTLKEICYVLGVSADYLLSIHQPEDENLERNILKNRINELDDEMLDGLNIIVNQLISLQQKNFDKK